MLLLRTDSLPSGEQWLYELKLDGYRAIGFKRNGNVSLRSRNDNDFNERYPAVVKALGKLPDNTVVDGEVVAFDQEGRPSFNALQNYGSAPAPVVYYVFDVLVLAGQDLRREPLQKRRELLEQKVLPKLPEPVRYSAPLDADLPVLIQSVKAHGLEGLVAGLPFAEDRAEGGLIRIIGARVPHGTNRSQSAHRRFRSTTPGGAAGVCAFHRADAFAAVRFASVW